MRSDHDEMRRTYALHELLGLPRYRESQLADDRVSPLPSTGRGERLEYRARHKDGTLRILESVVTAIPNEEGQSERLVIVNRDITERKRAEETLAHNALHDPLTNLPNRTLFLDRVRHVLALSQRHKSYKSAVLFIDLDEFKFFNDSLGHAAGDALLIQIARRLSVSIRGRIRFRARPRRKARAPLRVKRV
jgi:predicted signal transduction protein with EAL and GGDEF domain